jgi:predicted metal-dependent peptidase
VTPAASPALSPEALEARRVSALRLQLCDRHPFWGHLLLHVRLVAAPGLGAFAATDCLRHIWYDPQLTRLLSQEQLGFVLAHEVGHQLLATRERARGRDRHLWNCAADYAINRIVARIPRHEWSDEPLYQPPTGDLPGLGPVAILLDPRYDGLIAEAIYEHLLTTGAGPTVPVPVTLHLPDGRELPGLSDHQGGIDVHLPLELDDDAQEDLQERVREAVAAWEQSGRRGQVPGRLELLVHGRGRSRVPWARLLQRFVGEALPPADYSLRQPSRRFLAFDLIVPGLVRTGPPEVVVAVDTSGSMGERQLVAVATELGGLADLVPELTVLLADAKVQQVVPPRELPAFLRQVRLRGGGGTDHRPVFAWIAEHVPGPAFFVGLSDLFSRFPEGKPAYPVLWVAPAHHGRAPWGTVVELPAEPC